MFYWSQVADHLVALGLLVAEAVQVGSVPKQYLSVLRLVLAVFTLSRLVREAPKPLALTRCSPMRLPLLVAGKAVARPPH